MARSKSKLVPPSTTAITSTSTTTSIPILPQTSPNADDSHPPDPTPTQNQEKDSASPPPLERLTSAISLSLRFLSESDLLLPPAQSLTLSSLLRSSAFSLISIVPNNNINIIISNITSSRNLPPPSPTLTSCSSSSSFCWYRRFLSSPLSSSLFPSHFHLSKPSFNLLLSHLSPSLLSLSSSSSPLPPDLKLATALFRLAHAAPFPFLARRFGLPSPSLAARAFYEVIRALALNLFPLSSSSSSSSHHHHLPHCHAALLYSRLPVSGVFGSLIAQFLIDSNSRFLDVSVGWHGSMNPPDILPRTKLFTSHSEVLGPGNYFIGHSCCPLLPWLLTPYKNLEAGASSKAAVFNSMHARGMEVAERAVARLKRRWRLLEMEWKEECVEALPYVVVASCLLHNFLIKCGEMEEGEEGGGREVMGFKEFEGKGDEEGEMVRDVIASHLSQVLLK